MQSLYKVSDSETGLQWNIKTTNLPSYFSVAWRVNSVNANTPTTLTLSSTQPMGINNGDVIGAFIKDGQNIRCLDIRTWNSSQTNELIFSDDTGSSTSPNNDGFIENTLPYFQVWRSSTNKLSPNEFAI